MSGFRMIDTHCHLNMPEFEGDIEGVVERCKSSGVVGAIIASTVADEFDRTRELCGRYDMLYYMAGIHPHDAKTARESHYSLAEKHLADEKCCGIGEIGLDYHYDLSPRDVQMEVFSNFLDIALEHGVPVSIHSREATNDTVDILLAKRGLRGVIHCFSGDEKLLKVGLDMGLYFGIGGILTFRNSGLRSVINSLPQDRIVLETDAPYLAPVPMRGKRNEPSFLRYILLELSRIVGMSPKDVADRIYENTNKLFF